MPDNLQEENLKLKRAVNELQILNEISAAISAFLGSEEVNHLIVQKCMKYFEAEQGAIWRLKEEEQNISPETFVREMDMEYNGLPFKIGASLAGWILKHRRPLLVNNLAEDKFFSKLTDEYSRIHCFAAVPLTIKNRIIGILSLFNKKTEEGFTRDDIRMLSIVALQSAQVIENARLYDEEKKLRELEDDQKAARHIQQTLLPDKNPSLENYDITGISNPAKMVGGDYYDYIELKQDKWGIAVADVSGKGTPAALLMASLQTCLTEQAGLNMSVSETIDKVNQVFSRFLKSKRFITMIYGLLDLKKNTFTYVNAGHNYPLIITRDGNVRQIEGSDLILGISREAIYQERELSLQKGEILLIYTDGITEATNSVGEMYGEQRLEFLLKDSQFLSAAELKKRILDSVQKFQGDAIQSDDITVVVIKHI
ncbi:MAG: SpoIIE family protein phosphatase [candidate division Zixibacteria bacterium]|nr:SpoIIE family protein phosphatase [candidate division Zixibacteria bacterium]